MKNGVSFQARVHQVNLRLTADEQECLKRLAHLDNETDSGVLRAALRAWLVCRLLAIADEQPTSHRMVDFIPILEKAFGLPFQLGTRGELEWKPFEEDEAWRPLAGLLDYVPDIFYPFESDTIFSHPAAATRPKPLAIRTLREVQERTGVTQPQGTVRLGRSENGRPRAGYIVTWTGTPEDENVIPDRFDGNYFHLSKEGLDDRRSRALDLNVRDPYPLWLFRRVRYRNDPAGRVQFEDYGRVQVEAFDPYSETWKLRLLDYGPSGDKKS